MDELLNQNILSRTGRDSYSISKLKNCNEEIVMKDEMGVQVNQVGEKVQRGNDEDYLYMKALYHVLPLAYVTISELQTSRENAIPWNNKRNGVDGRGFTKYVEHDKTSCSRLSQEKHTSKTSTVYIRS
ncbi:hypothetical protein MKW92_035304 [Papaver armeniacum]|nr:hypothetical protein MKW92_035304 [Papaver armeniacum]